MENKHSNVHHSAKYKLKWNIWYISNLKGSPCIYQAGKRKWGRQTYFQGTPMVINNSLRGHCFIWLHIFQATKTHWDRFTCLLMSHSSLIGLGGGFSGVPRVWPSLSYLNINIKHIRKGTNTQSSHLNSLLQGLRIYVNFGFHIFFLVNTIKQLLLTSLKNVSKFLLLIYLLKYVSYIRSRQDTVCYIC